MISDTRFGATLTANMERSVRTCRALSVQSRSQSVTRSSWRLNWVRHCCRRPSSALFSSECAASCASVRANELLRFMNSSFWACTSTCFRSSRIVTWSMSCSCKAASAHGLDNINSLSSEWGIQPPAYMYPMITFHCMTFYLLCQAINISIAGTICVLYHGTRSMTHCVNSRLGEVQTAIMQPQATFKWYDISNGSWCPSNNSITSLWPPRCMDECCKCFGYESPSRLTSLQTCTSPGNKNLCILLWHSTWCETHTTWTCNSVVHQKHCLPLVMEPPKSKTLSNHNLLHSSLSTAILRFGMRLRILGQ